MTLKEKLWAAVLAYTEVDFRHHMEELKKINKDAFNYLDKIDPSGWSIASAYTEVDFRHHMKELKKINKDVFNYQNKIDPRG